MGWSAYQISGYQNNSYQIARQILKGGGGKVSSHDYIGAQETFKRTYQAEQKRLQEEKSKAEKQLAKKEAEIAKLEEKRLQYLADKGLQLKLIRLMHELEALKQERAELLQRILFFIREEEDLITILYSLLIP